MGRVGHVPYHVVGVWRLVRRKRGKRRNGACKIGLRVNVDYQARDKYRNAGGKRLF